MLVQGNAWTKGGGGVGMTPWCVVLTGDAYWPIAIRCPSLGPFPPLAVVPIGLSPPCDPVGECMGGVRIAMFTKMRVYCKALFFGKVDGRDLSWRQGCRHVASMLQFSAYWVLVPSYFEVLGRLPCSFLFHRVEPVGNIWGAKPPPPTTLMVPYWTL